MVKAKKFVITKHCLGEPTSRDFSLEEFDLPTVENGEILVQAEYISVDAGLRAYIPLLPLGRLMIGRQVAKIIESKNPNWPVGKYVLGGFGWVTHHVLNPDVPPEAKLMKMKPYLLPDFNGLTISLALGILGLSGNTAYFGFTEICQPKAGETLVVSAAAGAVGSHVGQIGKILGLTVIGITGSDAKCKWLVDELKFDHAINYKSDDVLAALKKAAPNGIDCYFDNVGGEIASAVINQMNERGRVSVCGSVSSYNSDRINPPKATILQPALVFKQLRMEGFVVYRWIDKWTEGIHQNAKWIHEGKLKYKETVTEGFENTINAFIGLLKGENFGKAVVKVIE